MSPFKKFYVQREIKRILVIKLDHIGDVFLATPALKAIRQKFPESHITIVVGPWSREVLEGNPSIDEILIFNAYWHNRDKKKKFNIRETVSLIKSLREKKYDVFFDLRGDIIGILIGYLCGIPRRIGYGIEGGGFLLTNEVLIFPGKHQIDILLDAVKVVGEDINYSHPEIFLSEKEIKFADEFLLSHEINSRNTLIGIHMGAGYPSKIWMPERFAELINRISKKGLKVLLVGGSEDLKIFESARLGILDSVINAIGKTTIKETAALINRCRFFIGNDSFPVHVSAAMMIPTVVIFSAVNDSKRWAPKGEQVEVIEREVPCTGCEKRECKDIECMQSITVDEVFELFISIFSRISKF
jgi:heptosyltransferase-2